jgi:hypothetical protein
MLLAPKLKLPRSDRWLDAKQQSLTRTAHQRHFNSTQLPVNPHGQSCLMNALLSIHTSATPQPDKVSARPTTALTTNAASSRLSSDPVNPFVLVFSSHNLRQKSLRRSGERALNTLCLAAHKIAFRSPLAIFRAIVICYLCSVPLLFPKSALILENIGDEKEQIQRRADHWFHQAS